MDLVQKILRESILFITCAIFVAIIGLVVVDQIIMPKFVRQGIQVTVPDLAGLTTAQAQSRLARYGLNLTEQDARWDAKTPPGQIVYQNPAAGSKVKPNRKVYVVPSLGARLYAVPDMRNRTLRQASLWIQQTDLVIGEIIEETSDRVREGYIISQLPEPGTQVDAGTRVNLVVSTGSSREFVTMPNVIEMKFNDARRVLSALELRTDNIRYEFSTAYDPDVVIQQEPEFGTPIKRGSSVKLVVSKL
jgi:serine/threonine-protein kinase